MFDYHKTNNADVTIAVMPVPMEEASRFGVVVADEENRTEFQEKPENQRAILIYGNLYILSYVLKEALIKQDRRIRLW